MEYEQERNLKSREALASKLIPGLAKPRANAKLIEILELMEEWPLVWQNADGSKSSFNHWPLPKQRRLVELYFMLSENAPHLGLKLPTTQTIDPVSHHAFFTAEQAFDLYAAHVAHVLYVESHHLVPWTIKTLTQNERQLLFYSSSYHSIIKPSSQTTFPAGIQPGRDFIETPENFNLGEFIGDPRIGYRFLTGNTSASGQSLVGNNEIETLANLTIWMRDNVGHGSGNQPGTHRWLDQRLRAAPGLPVATANQGCHSASKLMVDLARSVNIPLLHARAQESDTTIGYYFGRTHGGLVYGWGKPQPRILWHTDQIYAEAGEPGFPIDNNGNLRPARDASLAYFYQRWRTPAQLMQAGFNYNLHFVVPGQGFGGTPVSPLESFAHYGVMSGYWNKNGTSNLPGLMRLEQHYELCSEYLLTLSCDLVLSAQLSNDINGMRGGFSPGQLPPLHTLAEYEARAAAGVAALGGCPGVNQALANWNASRGGNLMI